jgi:hypothetical protein
MKKQEPVSVKIEYTYDYDKFKLIGINRRVDKKHVVSISEAILIRNLLHLFPLVINKKWEVMDGQHRLSAVKIIESAKLLQLPIYYIMDLNITMDDISLLNSNKINWRNLDYLNYFAGKKVKDYVDTLEFMKQHPNVNFSAAIVLVSSEKRDIKKVKDGLLKADNISKAQFIMECIYELKARMDPYDAMWKTGTFIIAMKAIFNTKKYNHEVMMASEKNVKESWSRQINTRAYIYEINKIYNYHLPENKKVDFMKLTRQN